MRRASTRPCCGASSRPSLTRASQRRPSATTCAIKTWLRWLHAEGGYDVAADAGARAKAPRTVKDPIAPFTADEIARLFGACEPGTWRGQRQRAIVAALLDTGVRASELCGLRLADLDLDHWSVVVRAATDKTRKGRTIALGKRARLELGRWWVRQRGRGTMDQRPESAFFLGLGVRR